MRLISVALLAFGIIATGGFAAEPRFPLKVSDNHRHLVDRDGTPFLYNADTPWMIFTKLTEAEAGEYITLRKQQGFTALQVQLTGFLGMTNVDGDLPFAGAPPEQDFTQPNEMFFSHVDKVVKEAQRQGMLLAIAPAWSGCCGEGWSGKAKDGTFKPLNRNGAVKSRDLGRWLGKRYGRFDNVMWILGGDNDPDNARAEIRGIGLGLKDTAPRQLITYHAASTHSSTDVWPSDEDWLDVSMVYTYFRGFNKAWNKNQPDVYEVSHEEFAKIPVRPFFLGESTYEGEHGDWGSAVQARKQAYWCVLSGGFGHAYGSPNWNFPKNWRELMRLPGAESFHHFRSLLDSRPWSKLVPDVQNVVAVEGRGAFATNDCAVTALAEDGSFALSYLPTSRSLTIDLTKISGNRVSATWFNPRTGDSALIGEFIEKKHHLFKPPGDGDWVLVLDDAAKGFAPPGRALKKGRYSELRIYDITPGKMEAVLARFRDHIGRIRTKHGIETLAYWTATDKEGHEKFIYMIACDSDEKFKAAEKAFGADPEFLQAYAASNKAHGQTVDKIVSYPMHTQDWSPRLDFNRPASGRAFELRIYDLVPEKVELLLANYRNARLRLFEKHGFSNLGFWTSDINNAPPKFIILLSHQNPRLIDVSKAAYHADPEWKEKVDEWSKFSGPTTTGVISLIMTPTEFSPLQ